jgi:hypothetical protein
MTRSRRCASASGNPSPSWCIAATGSRDTWALSWVAWHLGTEEDLAWWEIPVWAGERKVKAVRVLSGALLLGLGFGVTAVPIAGRPGVAYALGAAMLAVYCGVRMSPSRYRRIRWPRVLVPRWPRSARETVILVVVLLTGVPARPVLIRLWSEPVPTDATPDGSYRACRRSAALDGLACAYTGIPVALLALAWGPAMLAAGGLLAGLVFVVLLTDDRYVSVKLAEVMLLLSRHRRVRFAAVLSGSSERLLLRAEGPCYRFQDATVQRTLAAAYESEAAARARRIPAAVAAADSRGGVRPWLLGLLTQQRIKRAARDFGLGVLLAVLGGAAAERVSGSVGWTGLAVFVIGAPFLGVISFLVIVPLGRGVVRFIRWSLWVTSRLTRRRLVVVLAVIVELACWIVVLTGTGRTRHAIGVFAVALLPAVLVAGVGGWVCVLAHQRWHDADGRWRRRIADGLLAVTFWLTLLQLAKPDLLGAQGSAGLLFPVAVWLSVRGWRTMNSSSRFAVKALADIGVSLLLGGSAVLLLVWLASVLHMPPAEVAAVHGAVTRAGAIIDLPWWFWLTLFVLLAGASLAFAVWAGALGGVARWFSRLHVVPAAVVSRRVLASVHVALLVTVLIGLAAPPAVGTLLRDRLAAQYTETLTDDLQARGELAAFRQISRSFTGQASRPAVAALAAMVSEIDDISKPPAGDHDATVTELDLARRLGELQAAALALGHAPPVEQAAAADADKAGFDAPVSDAADMSARTEDAAEEDDEDDATEKLVDQAAELAATAVSEALRIPRIGDTEVVQIVREYLMSLVENSPLKDTFAAWAGHLTTSAEDKEPPAAEDIVVPDPVKLENAAVAAATTQLAATPVTDPAAVQHILTESAVVAAVNLTNQVRYLQEDDGPCAGCAQPVPPADQPADHDDEPVDGG